MTIKQAVAHMIESERFQKDFLKRDNVGVKCRMFVSRYKRNKLKTVGGIVDILLQYGYKIQVVS